MPWVAYRCRQAGRDMEETISKSSLLMGPMAVMCALPSCWLSALGQHRT